MATSNMVQFADRDRWNLRYTTATPTFRVHPLVTAAIAVGMPAGPVLELASGPSGSALALAAYGRDVTVVDTSDVALRQLQDEARRRGLTERLTCLHTDLNTWTPAARSFALVYCAFYWDLATFSGACAAVLDYGLLGWETYVGGPAPGRRPRAAWCLRPGEPDDLLPRQFAVLAGHDLVGPHGPSRRILAIKTIPRTRDSWLS